MESIFLACCPDGLPIQYNRNERNKETVFFLTNDFQIVQNMTFRCPIFPDEEKWCEWKTKCLDKPVHVIEEGLLFYSFQYQVSYAHYLTQTLPLLVEFLQNTHKSCKLLVPSHTQNNLQNELLTLLKIPEERILLLQPNQLYKVQKLSQRKFFETPPSPFTKDHVWIFQMICKELSVLKKPNIRCVYVKRDGKANPQANNSECGYLRQIKNESELIEKLQSKFHFEVITLGDKTLLEKANCLAGIDILITPLGANCMNFVFAQAPNNILLLNNDRPIGHDYYIPLASAVQNNEIPFTLFTYPIIEHSDPTNQWNGSFLVDIEQICEWVTKNLSLKMQ